MQTQSTAGIFQPPAHRKGGEQEGFQHTSSQDGMELSRKQSWKAGLSHKGTPMGNVYTSSGSNTHSVPWQHTEVGTPLGASPHPAERPGVRMPSFLETETQAAPSELGCGTFASSPNKRFMSSVKKILPFYPCDKIISYPLQVHSPFHQPPPSFCKNLKSRCPPCLPESISPDPDGL